jgi:hypothetical protein
MQEFLDKWSSLGIDFKQIGRGVVAVAQWCTTRILLTMPDLYRCVGRLECQRKRLSRRTDVEHHASLTRTFGDAP